MASSKVDIDSIINRPDFDPQQQGAQFWYEAYLEQRHCLEQTQQELASLKREFAELKETLRKLSERSSENSSQPSSQDGYKKKSKLKNLTFALSKAEKFPYLTSSQAKAREGLSRGWSIYQGAIPTAPRSSVVGDSRERHDHTAGHSPPR